MFARKIQSAFWIFAIGVLLNYLWELAQAPLYVGLESYDAGVLWHCFVASLGDGIMVWMIFVAGLIIFRRWDWFHRPGFLGYLVMILAGLILAILVEWVAVHIWAVGITKNRCPRCRDFASDWCRSFKCFCCCR